MMKQKQTKQQMEKPMRLMISLLAGFLVACGDKESDDTASEEIAEEVETEDSAEGSEEETSEESEE